MATGADGEDRAAGVGDIVERLRFYAEETPYDGDEALMIEAAGVIAAMRAALEHAAAVFGDRQIDSDLVTERDGVEFDAICRMVSAAENARGRDRGPDA